MRKKIKCENKIEISVKEKKVVRIFLEMKCKNKIEIRVNDYKKVVIFFDHNRNVLFAGIQEPRWPWASKTLCTPLE